jgi:hypothetical protein
MSRTLILVALAALALTMLEAPSETAVTWVQVK